MDDALLGTCSLAVCAAEAGCWHQQGFTWQDLRIWVAAWALASGIELTSLLFGLISTSKGAALSTPSQFKEHKETDPTVGLQHVSTFLPTHLSSQVLAQAAHFIPSFQGLLPASIAAVSPVSPQHTCNKLLVRPRSAPTSTKLS
jgi:hypothetical protein